MTSKRGNCEQCTGKCPRFGTTKYTCGLWGVSQYRDSDSYGTFRAVHGLHGYVAKVYPGQLVDDQYAMMDANARLIAAAPELLEALEEIVSEECSCADDDCATCDVDWDCHMSKYKQLIAKAKGEPE